MWVQCPVPADLALQAEANRAQFQIKSTDNSGTLIEVVPVPFLAPPRPVSYGSWGYWMSPTLRRALDRLYGEWRFDLLHAHNLAPMGHAAARWVAALAG